MAKRPSRSVSALRNGLLDVVPQTRVGRRLHQWHLWWVHRRIKGEVYPLSQPHLDRSEFRTIYSGVGAAMVVAGFAVMANWVSIVQAAVRPNGLRVAGPMFYLGAAIVLLGVYCFVASMSSAPWLPLPGKGPMIRAAEGSELRDEFHRIASTTLGFARVAGLTLRESVAPTSLQVSKWYANVVRVSIDVWGDTGSLTVLDLGENRAWARQELISEVVNPTMLQVEVMIARVSSAQIGDGLDKHDFERLKECSDFFSGMVRQFLDPAPEEADTAAGGESE